MPKPLTFEPVLDRPDLVPPCITHLMQDWKSSSPVEDVQVAEIDQAYSDSTSFCEQYGIDPKNGANCVITEAVRGETRTLVACVIPIGTRADLNNTVKKMLNVRRVSFAPLDEVITATGMEYGSITPIGLPTNWHILIDSRIAEHPGIIIGGGLRKSKIRLPGKTLTEIPNAGVVTNLGLIASR